MQNASKQNDEWIVWTSVQFFGEEYYTELFLANLSWANPAFVKDREDAHRFKTWKDAGAVALSLGTKYHGKTIHAYGKDGTLQMIAYAPYRVNKDVECLVDIDTWPTDGSGVYTKVE